MAKLTTKAARPFQPVILRCPGAAIRLKIQPMQGTRWRVPLRMQPEEQKTIRAAVHRRYPSIGKRKGKRASSIVG